MELKTGTTIIKNSQIISYSIKIQTCVSGKPIQERLMFLQNENQVLYVQNVITQASEALQENPKLNGYVLPVITNILDASTPILKDTKLPGNVNDTPLTVMSIKGNSIVEEEDT